MYSSNQLSMYEQTAVGGYVQPPPTVSAAPPSLTLGASHQPHMGLSTAAGYVPVGPQTQHVPYQPPSSYKAINAAAVAAAAAADYTQKQLLKQQEQQITLPPNSEVNTDKLSDQKNNLIVNYLPSTMNHEEFKALFAAMGELESCKLVRDKTTGQSLGYGFVNYVRLEDAQKAVNSLNGLRMQNKFIKVSFARPSSELIKGANLYVSGLAKTVTQSELEQMFTQFGHIITTRILTEPDGSSKGVGFVRFDKKEEADEAIAKLNQTTPQGATEVITVKFANSPNSGSQKTILQIPSISPLAILNQNRRLPGPIHSTTAVAGRFRYSPMGTDVITGFPAASVTGVPGAQSYTIFVYNLAPETEESILWQLFGPFGAVLQVKIIRDFNTNKCKGYGFVTMSVYEEALAAITHLHGTTLANRVLQVSFKSATGRKM